jgi:6-phospho-beta-glucosidase
MFIGRSDAADFTFGLRVPASKKRSTAAFALSSIRVGGMARAQDERIAIEHGFAGQETTGPEAWRWTIPVALDHASSNDIPEAWLINSPILPA